MNPLISILTPAFNHEQFIAPCIDSVLAQDYPNWEQIIIDDGSTDRTAMVAAGYTDPRIRCVRQDHQGPEKLADTYNRALQFATGDIVAILEGDDMWPPDKLSAILAPFANPHVVLVFGDARDVDALGNQGRRTPRDDKQRRILPRSILHNDPVGAATAYLLTAAGQTLIPPSTVAVRRQALQAIRGFQGGTGLCPTDIPTFVRLSREGIFCYIPQILGFRRRHIASATLTYIESMPASAMAFAMASLSNPLWELTEDQRLEIQRSWQTMERQAQFTSGRTCLVNGDWSNARRNFQRAMYVREYRMLIAAGLGWLLSWLHLDLEHLFRAAGRVALTSASASMNIAYTPDGHDHSTVCSATDHR
jgi:glycosyltransferase involved in cell wall biosynthesis